VLAIVIVLQARCRPVTLPVARIQHVPHRAGDDELNPGASAQTGRRQRGAAKSSMQRDGRRRNDLHLQSTSHRRQAPTADGDLPDRAPTAIRRLWLQNRGERALASLPRRCRAQGVVTRRSRRRAQIHLVDLAGWAFRTGLVHEQLRDINLIKRCRACRSFGTDGCGRRPVSMRIWLDPEKKLLSHWDHALVGETRVQEQRARR